MSSIRINAKVSLVGIAPAELIDKLGAEVRNKAVGFTVARLVRKHLEIFGRSHPNALGGKRSNFVNVNLAQKTGFSASGEEAIVAISDYRASIFILGGKIMAGKNPSFKSGKPTAALTIPAHSESYNTRAAKFDGKSTLIWFKQPHGKCVGMIVDKIQQRLGVGKVRKDGAITGGKLTEKGVFNFKRVLYWLVTEANIKGQPDAIPTEQEIVDGAVQGVRALVQSVFRNSTKATAVVYGSN